ncbi:MAG: hypothetical protein KDB07_04130 [Planctomycetes bacterium]|nr:hypothetical protein [Planctomycetota bacterium]
MFQAFDASTSGLFAERMRMNTIANNLANAYTTRNQFGEKVPFRRRLAIFEDGNTKNSDPNLGVTVLDIVDDNADFRIDYKPGDPDAVTFSDIFETDSEGVPDFGKPKEPYQGMSQESLQELASREGYVLYPNINAETELVDAMMAARSYEANLSAIEISKSIISDSLSIIA